MGRRVKCNQSIIERQIRFYYEETIKLCNDLKGLEYATDELFLKDVALIFRDLKSLRQYLDKCRNNRRAGICTREAEGVCIGSCYFETCLDEVKDILIEMPKILRKHRTACMGIRKQGE